MPRTHLSFKRLRPAVVEAANALFDQKPWRLDQMPRQQVAQQFINAVSSSYGVMRADIELHASSAPAQFHYSPAIFEADNLDDEPRLIGYPKIRMRGWSVTTLFYAVRMHVLAQEGDESKGSDPEGWAHSLFYAVRPAMFRARAREGRIIGVTAKDTFNAESWDKLTAAGFTFEDRLIGSPEQWSEVLGIRLTTSSALNSIVPPEGVDELPDEEEYDEELSDEELASIFGEDEIDRAVEVHDAGGLTETTDAEDESEDSDDEPVAGRDYDEAVPANPDWVNDDGSLNREAIDAEFSDGLDELNRDAIRALAATHAIEGRGRMNKDALVAALRELGVRA